jgi:hypothetical protein
MTCIPSDKNAANTNQDKLLKKEQGATLIQTTTLGSSLMLARTGVLEKEAAAIMNKAGIKSAVNQRLQ